jgi:hypothetical protein
LHADTPETSVSEPADPERLRELLTRLEAIQSESERIRERISNIVEESRSWPRERRRGNLFDDAPPVSESNPPRDGGQDTEG